MLLDFYKSVVESLGLEVTEDNFVMVKFIDSDGKEGKRMLTIEGKSVVLPTKENIKTAISVDDDGKPIVTKILFNPLNEDVIKGDSASIKLIKNIIATKISYSFAGTAELLMLAVNDKAIQKNTDMTINKFMAEVNKASKPGTKKIVNDNTLKNWSKMLTRSIKETRYPKLTKLHLRKGGKYKGVKYYKTSVLEFPIYEILLENSKDNIEELLDIKTRATDIDVYKILYEFIFDKMDETHTYVTASNDKESPSFVALFKMYISVANKINKILKQLKTLDEHIYDRCKLPTKITLKDLDNLDIYHSELLMIPNDIDMNRKKADVIEEVEDALLQTDPYANVTNGISASAPTATAQLLNTQQAQKAPLVPTQQQARLQQQTNVDENLSLIDKILHGNDFNASPIYQNDLMKAAPMQQGYATLQQDRPVYRNDLGGVRSNPILNSTPTGLIPTGEKYVNRNFMR